jgi:hypothetical protein
VKSIYLLLCISAKFGMNLKSLDYKTAFLNSKVPGEIYIKLPLDVAKRYFGILNDWQNVFKLKKALYGLHESPILWFETIVEFLLSIGFKQLVSDPCCFIYQQEDMKTPIIMLVYVDDTYVAYEKENESKWLALKKKIMLRFNVSDLGTTDTILQMKVVFQEDGSIILNQTAYILQLADLYQVNIAKKTSTSPCNTVTKNLTDPSIISQSPLLSHDQLKIYQAIIGSLNYLSNRTRLDISLITGVLARHVCEPHLIHLKAAYKVIEYLLATKDYGLLFCKSENDKDTLHVDIYSDASHNDTDDHKPTLGMLMLIDNCPITWMSKKAKVISQSTMESEFYSLCEATMEAQFITNYL